MDFSGNSKKSGRSTRNKKQFNRVGHNLQFYKIPPTGEISLQEFEEYAIDRLKVLKAVEVAGIRLMKGSNEYIQKLQDELRKTSLGHDLIRTDKKEDKDFRQKDLVSHFILRLAYCRSEELRRWFMQQELELFRFRFLREGPDSRDEFLRENCLNYEPISDDLKTELDAELRAAAGSKSGVVDTIEYFKVPFTEVFDLVSKRKVYLEDGYAYVSRDDMISIVITHYRSHLSHSLAVTTRALPHLEEDGRLLPMLCGLSKRYLGQDFNAKKSNVGEITADMIEMLSKKSFPLCMQQLHQSLRQNHHLRHGGRQQYGLFLKGIGVSLEEAMRFWRTEFCKAMDVDKFDKQYSYNIRHNYGKEGKRTNYTPYSCMKIITTNPPGPGDFHGCPFKHMEVDMLAQKLRGQHISKDNVEKITKCVKTGHYQIACAQYFEATHNIRNPEDSASININHPNGYFLDSYKLLNGPKEGTKPVPNTPKVIKVKVEGTGTSSSQTNKQTDLNDMDDDDLIASMETDM
ncbi:DNA primase large subunit-like [Mytilus californianus]|uniref:DNA primase large subunit-like n=1 Tax=Mytilus californianus TaxID=6549 RepID=UPI002248701F|nr:DNA primase large subunit-like [Mytilus californianus]